MTNEKQKIAELESALKEQQEELKKLRKHAKRQKWWNVYFAFKK